MLYEICGDIIRDACSSTRKHRLCSQGESILVSLEVSKRVGRYRVKMVSLFHICVVLMYYLDIW